MTDGNEEGRGSLMVPNSFMVPNVYVDDLLHLLTFAELKVMLYVMRRTFGFHKLADRISLGQFTDGIRKADGEYLDHGTGLTRSTAVKALKDLVEMGLLLQAEPYNMVERISPSYQVQPDAAKVRFGILLNRRGDVERKTGQRMAIVRATKGDGLGVGKLRLPTGLLDRPAHRSIG